MKLEAGWGYKGRGNERYAINWVVLGGSCHRADKYTYDIFFLFQHFSAFSYCN